MDLWRWSLWPTMQLTQLSDIIEWGNVSDYMKLPLQSKGFIILFFSHMRLYSPGPVNAPWCVILVALSFNCCLWASVKPAQCCHSNKPWSVPCCVGSSNMRDFLESLEKELNLMFMVSVGPNSFSFLFFKSKSGYLSLLFIPYWGATLTITLW